MKIYVMTDMEGAAGILNHDDWVLQNSRYYEKGKRLLTEEVNAAVDGLAAGGATEIVICDGHGAGGIDPELLDARAMLLRIEGESAPYPFGLDASFDGACWVGQHAKAGTDYSHITHTEWFNYIDISINDTSIGEYGLTAFCAMELGVPSILACGEEALCREAEALTPGVITVSVKRGLMPDGLDHLDTDEYRKAKLSALHLSPLAARQRLRAGALDAMCRLREDPTSFHYPDIHSPYTYREKTRKWGERPPQTRERSHPDSLIALLNMPFTEG
ncbi:MAG: M55 family metallopeptidase [Armatimonadota bacterium]